MIVKGIKSTKTEQILTCPTSWTRNGVYYPQREASEE